MTLLNLKLAIRSLLKNKFYSILIIGGFSIGFASCILIGLYYNSEHSVNKDFANYKQIYRLYDKGEKDFDLDYELFPVLAENYPEIEIACPVNYLSGFEISVVDKQTHTDTRVDNIISTNNNFFQIFQPQIISSLSAELFSGHNSVVITETVAKRMYGDKNPVGQSLTIFNYLEATITGVIKELPENSTFKAEILLNSENEDFRLSKTCNNGICVFLTHHFLLLRKGTEVNKFSARLQQTINNYDFELKDPELQNLSAIYLSSLSQYDTHSKGNSKMLTIFLFIGVLILALSSINYLNYVVSIQYSKLKETGINKTVGAGWKQLVAYLVTEVAIGILISVIFSFLLAILLLPATGVLFGKQLHIHSLDFLKILPFFMGIVFIIILVNSLAPVYLVSRFNITDFLSGSRKRRGKQISKQVTLIFQLTASIALIAIVMVIFKQLSYIKHFDLGFNEERLVKIDLPFNNPNLTVLKQQTGKLSFAKSSTLSFGCPGMVNNTMGSNTGENSFDINCIFIDDDFVRTMGIELLEGRQFLDGDKGKACIINEEAYKQYGWENLEGKRFNNRIKGGYEVVGLAKNFNVKSLHQNIEPAVLLYDTQKGQYNVLSVRLAAGNTGQQIKQIRNIWDKLIPDETMNVTFYDDQFQAMYVKEEKLAKSITFFSFIAIALTCMGILGQILLSSLTRTKEIGIRKVNGAKVSEILAMLNKDFVRWVIVAFVIASPIVYFAMNKWLENFAYKTSLSWWIFALAGLLALGIALLTVSWQSWRAATRNPVEALRYE
ncbi:ABC transporter permease [Maribellus maritimus]|uniref:ABC transporter permease n=1 Tax=Maribellus maritimus TaxID=2870838 RepID=UPI001EEB1A18|nr:ABC transporter permease [Maribellus maritimus]MCG6189789.1 ABC transporter permease [Maribellus maritimus]